MLHRHDFSDFLKGVAVWAAWLWAVNWNQVAAFLSAVFTLILILDKFGLFAPLKARLHYLFNPPKPQPRITRAPQDE